MPHRYFTRELADGRAAAGAEEDGELGGRQGIESADEDERQRGEGREAAEEKNDERALDLEDPELAHAGVGDAGAESPDERADGREGGVALEAGLHDEHGARKGHEDADKLPQARALAEEEPGEDDGKERRGLVEHLPGRDGNVGERVEVREDAQGAEGRAGY